MDDQWLVNFLRCSKHSLQRTKEKLDAYYSVRTLLTEFFSNRDTASPVMQRISKLATILPLSTPENSDNEKIIFCQWHGLDPNTTPLNIVIARFFMTLDILLHEDDNSIISGFKVIVDYSELSMGYFLQFTPPFLIKLMKCITNAYPLRLRAMYLVNTPKGFETVFNILKTAVSEKIKNRLYLFSEGKYDRVFEHIPQSAIPKEYGGSNACISSLAEQWQMKVDSYRDWFLEDSKYGSNESLRIEKPKTTADLFGIEGSFRKLAVD